MAKLPDDLKKYARVSKLKPVLVFVLCEATAALFFFLTKDFMYQTEYIAKYNIIGHAFYTVIFVIPLFISGIYPALHDKTYIGTVEKVKVSTTQDYQRSFKPSIDTGYNRNTIYLFVKDDNGDIEKRKVYTTRSMDNQELDYFKAGDRVFHIYGSKYTVIIPKPSDTMVQCAVCGITTDIKEERCHKCGHTLPTYFAGK
ncbi:MAG: hypothetical protein J5879_04130 [Clostridia bacterium]|nr:hypothetical protein [Clostridia bacterium]